MCVLHVLKNCFSLVNWYSWKSKMPNFASLVWFAPTLGTVCIFTMSMHCSVILCGLQLEWTAGFSTGLGCPGIAECTSGHWEQATSSSRACWQQLARTSSISLTRSCWKSMLLNFPEAQELPWLALRELEHLHSLLRWALLIACHSSWSRVLRQLRNWLRLCCPIFCRATMALGSGYPSLGQPPAWWGLSSPRKRRKKPPLAARKTWVLASPTERSWETQPRPLLVLAECSVWREAGAGECPVEVLGGWDGLPSLCPPTAHPSPPAPNCPRGPAWPVPTPSYGATSPWLHPST